MATRYFGERIKRNEDPQLLTGHGLFVDDVRLPDMLHGAVLRSPHAHARIHHIDVSKALQVPGVVAVFTARDLGPVNGPLPLLIGHPSLRRPQVQCALAVNKVKFAGEPVAFVVARDRYIAEDARELIEVDYEVLPAVVDLEEAVKPDSPKVHDELPDNIAAVYAQKRGDVDEAFRRADFVFKERIWMERGAAMPMETRSVVAFYDPYLRTLTVWDTTQAPIPIRNLIARIFGLPEERVRVIAPHVGGGFGPKIMMGYPEEVLVPFAAMKLGRPVKWTEDRYEEFFAMNQERGQLHEAEIAVTRDGLILGVRDRFLHDSGAYVPYGVQTPIITATTLPGPYHIPNYFTEFTAVYTNKITVSPYRGAGRPHGVFVMERLMDRVARELGIDRAEVRMRNFIKPDQFPYHYELIYQDGAEVLYDSGNYPGTLSMAMEMIGYRDWPQEKDRYRRQGRRVGLGIACYVEGTGIGPYEGARVHVDANGRITVATSVGTQGQGHYTSFAQIVADELGVDPRHIEVITGDSALFSWGTGTFASRAAVVAGNAVAKAAREVRQKAIELAAKALEANPEDIELADGKAFVKGSPDTALTLAELALKANPLRATIPPDFKPGLEATGYYAPSHGTFANGVHACKVEVDVQTGNIRFLQYVVVHDCGRVINPMILEGQIHGGVAQGIGGAFYERLHYDENGQLLNASFMDFLIPTAMEVPKVEIGHLETPTPHNPLGVKGAGEAGVIPVNALLAQALEDALDDYGIVITDMPLDPNRLLQLIEHARTKSEVG
jgi:carbon-monoxide dehydrogenase large subunit